MWEILFGLVVHTHIYAHTAKLEARQNDLSSYANCCRLWLTFAAFAFELQLKCFYPDLLLFFYNVHIYMYMYMHYSMYIVFRGFIYMTLLFVACNVCICNLAAAHKSCAHLMCSHIYSHYSHIHIRISVLRSVRPVAINTQLTISKLIFHNFVCISSYAAYF